VKYQVYWRKSTSEGLLTQEIRIRCSVWKVIGGCSEVEIFGFIQLTFVLHLSGIVLRYCIVSTVDFHTMLHVTHIVHLTSGQSSLNSELRPHFGHLRHFFWDFRPKTDVFRPCYTLQNAKVFSSVTPITRLHDPTIGTYSMLSVFPLEPKFELIFFCCRNLSNTYSIISHHLNWTKGRPRLHPSRK